MKEERGREEESTERGESAPHRNLTFESHELFRLCSIATVIAILSARFLSRFYQRSAETRSVRAIIVDS